MLTNVLLPTDLSEDQDLVMKFAAGLADLGVKRVVCAHVVNADGLEGPVLGAKVDEARERMLRSLAPLRAAGVDIDARVLTGEPERELLMLAAEGSFDCVVCGSSGKSAADRLIFGSVSDRLVRDSGLPSLTVRFELLRVTSDPADLARRFGRVLLIPTDFSATAARALNLALGFPRKQIGTVRILNVIPNGDGGEAEAEGQLKRLIDIAKGRGIGASPVIGHGAPEKAILREIQYSGISGVVIGSRGRTVLQEALMGSVSMTLMRQAPCPVLIVP